MTLLTTSDPDEIAAKRLDTLLAQTLAAFSDGELNAVTTELQALLRKLGKLLERQVFNGGGESLWAIRTVERDLARLSFFRRVGRFSIAEVIVDGDPDLALYVLDGTLVIECRYNHFAQRYDYLALNRSFERYTGSLDTVPWYEARVTRDEDGSIEVKFTR